MKNTHLISGWRMAKFGGGENSPSKSIKKYLLRKSAVNYSPFLKSNIMAQMKMSNIQKKFNSLLISVIQVKILLYIPSIREQEVFTVHINHISWQTEEVQFPSKNNPNTSSPELNMKKLSAPSYPSIFLKFSRSSFVEEGECLPYRQTTCKSYSTRNKLLDCWLQYITKT